jgi:hypothetical protein
MTTFVTITNDKPASNDTVSVTDPTCRPAVAPPRSVPDIPEAERQAIPLDDIH